MAGMVAGERRLPAASRTGETVMGSLLPIAQRSPLPYQGSLIPGAGSPAETAYSRRLGDAGAGARQPHARCSSRAGASGVATDSLTFVAMQKRGASVDRLVGQGVYVLSGVPRRSASGSVLWKRLNVIAPSGSGMSE